MNEITKKQKDNTSKKLKQLGITTEKEILNIKVSDLRNINENDKIEKLTLKDIDVIWLMQDAIKNKKLLDFFI